MLQKNLTFSSAEYYIWNILRFRVSSVHNNKKIYATLPKITVGKNENIC